MMTKRIKAKPVYKEPNSEDLALVFLLMAKRRVKEKRERAACERHKQEEVRRAS